MRPPDAGPAPIRRAIFGPTSSGSSHQPSPIQPCDQTLPPSSIRMRSAVGHGPGRLGTERVAVQVHHPSGQREPLIGMAGRGGRHGRVQDVVSGRHRPRTLAPDAAHTSPLSRPRLPSHGIRTASLRFVRHAAGCRPVVRGAGPGLLRHPRPLPASSPEGDRHPAYDAFIRWPASPGRPRHPPVGAGESHHLPPSRPSWRRPVSPSMPCRGDASRWASGPVGSTWSTRCSGSTTRPWRSVRDDGRGPRLRPGRCQPERRSREATTP